MTDVQVSNPFQPPERRRGGGLRRFLFWFLVFMLMLSWMRSCQPPPQPPPSVEPTSPLPRSLEPDKTKWPPMERQPPAKQGQRPMEGDDDWSLEEVKVQKPAAPDDGVNLTIPKSSQMPGSGRPDAKRPEPKKPEPKKTEKGDWSIEEVPSASSTAPSISNKQGAEQGATSKQEEEPKKSGPPKKTTKGDWEIEEVK